MSNKNISVSKARELLKISNQLIPYFNEVEANTFALAIKMITKNMEARKPEEK
jgi:hypothetical protein